MRILFLILLTLRDISNISNVKQIIMKEKSVYLIEFHSAIFRTCTIGGFSLDDLKTSYASLVEGVEKGERPLQFSGIVFSSKKKAKVYCDLHNTFVQNMSIYVGKNECSSLVYRYSEVSLL